MKLVTTVNRRRGRLLAAPFVAAVLGLASVPGSASAGVSAAPADAALVTHGNIHCGGGYENLALAYRAYPTGLGSLENEAGSWSLGPDYSMGCTVGTYDGPIGYASFAGSFTGTGAGCSVSLPQRHALSATLSGSGKVELPYNGTVVTVSTTTWTLVGGEFVITGSGSYNGFPGTISGHAAAMPWGICQPASGGGFSATIPIYSADLDFVY